MNFLPSKIFFVNFDLKNACKKDIEDKAKNHTADQEKDSHKIDFEAEWRHSGHADSVVIK